MRSSPQFLAAGLVLGFMISAVAQTAPAPPPGKTLTGIFSLVRYDMPIGNSDGYAPTRQLAARRLDEADPVDWPQLTLDGRPIFRDRAEEMVPLDLRKGAEAAPLFQARTDDVIQPGNHWLRAMDWRQGRHHIYTADKTARTSVSGDSATSRYELWTFPIRITGSGAPIVKNVVLKADGVVVYKKDSPSRSLTLLLPAGSYELSVDGRKPVFFATGILPVKLGSPRERTISTDLSIAGDGPQIRVQSLERPDDFPNRKEWNADLAVLGKPVAGLKASARPQGFKRYLGIEVPYSPMTLYAMALPHGRSGGFYRQGAAGFGGTYDQYAELLAATGFDAVFDQANILPASGDLDSIEVHTALLAQHGVKLGLQYDNNVTQPSLQHPNLTFFSHTLPEWHAPLYRSLSLAAQRFSGLPNFLGFSIGADNAGYASYWNWAPPSPDRPWGRAMVEFMGTPQPATPRGPELGAGEWPFEYPVKQTSEFLKYAARYDATFQQYGYFAEAVRVVNPKMVFTTGSFGSSPGPGARGGWPWASMPGRAMFEGLNIQQAYDWNQLHAAKPLHNVALTDRLRSYWPEKPTWALLDNDKFLYGREAYQRACVLALTRGISGLGTNFLPHASGPVARPDVVAYEQEMNAWIRQYGGVYAKSVPEPAIGIYFGQHEAIQRRIVTGENPPDGLVYQGSQEGKVTEALFLCHAAGWPARVITYQELMRGPLPNAMKTILLVGLNSSDASWNWAAGLEHSLAQFIDHGGKIIADAESPCPVNCTRTAMRVAAYQPESNLDPTPLLLERNRENIKELREAMYDRPKPTAVSADPTLWAVPTICGDTEYITVVNQATAEGDDAAEMLRPADPKATKPEIWKTKGNASLFVKPRTGALTWNTERPIYDVRSARKLSPEDAAQVDLTKDAFQWYALPPREITAPSVTLTKDIAGFYQAMVNIGGSEPIRGVPVKIAVTRGNDTATVFGASGFAIRLPVNETDASGSYDVTVTEQLSGLAGTAEIRVPQHPSSEPELRSSVQLHGLAAIAKFATRKTSPLAIALTPEQEQNQQLLEQVKALEDYYRSRGRTVSRGTVHPGGIVESLQPIKSPNRFPQWKTIASDLVLFGSIADNVLMLDQARAGILPHDLQTASPGCADVAYTRSPFVGEYDVINVLATDVAGMTTAVKSIIATGDKR